MAHTVASSSTTYGPGDNLVIPKLFRRNARRRAEHAAVVCECATLSYAEFARRISQLAGALQERGVRHGDRVGILMFNRAEFLEAVFACLELGACAVPLNFRHVQAELDYMLEHSGAVGVIADEQLATEAASARDRLPEVRFHLAVGRAPAGAEPYEDVLGAARAPQTDAEVDPDDVALLMYTSGTTGRPKAAMLTHSNLMWQAWNMAYELGAGETDVWLSGAPLFHIAGFAGALTYFHCGATVVIAPSTAFDPLGSIELLIANGVTTCFFVPTQWDGVCAVDSAERLSRSLRTAIWGASPATVATLKRMHETLRGVDIVSVFGQTEMSPVTTWLKGPESVRKLGSVGKPSVNVELRIVDNDGRDVPQGDVGEIVYRGPTTMKGYFRDAKATAEAFEGGWFHSGDLVSVDEDGFIFVRGRKKDMIISGGENVFPAEVENVLASHPGVAAVAVVGVPHERWVETPVAFIVRSATGTELDECELIEYCGDKLARYKHPSRVLFVDELPYNASGKVQKFVLQEQYVRGHWGTRADR